jgi:hypothetical protein
VALTKKLVDLAPDHNHSSIRSKETVTLQSILCGRRDWLEVKMNVVRALLARNIAVLSNPGGTVGGLGIDRAAYQRVVACAMFMRTQSVYQDCPGAFAEKANDGQIHSQVAGEN